MTELKGEINSSTMILGDFNTLLAIMDRPTIQDIKKQRTLNQLIITDIQNSLQKNNKIHVPFKCP